VDGYALAAWIRATEDLLTLDRPSAFVSTQQSPARHWPGVKKHRGSGQVDRYTTGQNRAARAFYSEGDCL
jgi:hypothetical protein